MISVDQAFIVPFGAQRDSRSKHRTLGHHGKRAGVYFIREGDRIVYVGMSASDVVKALYRHFYPWFDKRDPEHPRAVYDCDSEEITACILVTSSDQAHALERALIVSLNPRDNREKYEAFAGQLALVSDMIAIEPQSNPTDLPF